MHKASFLKIWIGLQKALISTQLNTFEMNWNSDCAPCVLIQHQCLISDIVPKMSGEPLRRVELNRNGMSRKHAWVWLIRYPHTFSHIVRMSVIWFFENVLFSTDMPYMSMHTTIVCTILFTTTSVLVLCMWLLVLGEIVWCWDSSCDSRVWGF